MAINEPIKPDSYSNIYTDYYKEQADGTFSYLSSESNRDIEFETGGVVVKAYEKNFDGYILCKNHPDTYDSDIIGTTYKTIRFRLYYKQYRRIQVGDNLSGKILHCNFPKTNTTVEWWTTNAGKGEGVWPEIITTTNGSISCFTTGANRTEEEIFVRYPKSASASTSYTTLFFQEGWNVWESLSTYQLPSDFGTVTNVINDSQEASSHVLEIPGVWNLVKIYPVSEPIWLDRQSKIYLGNQIIQTIYFGNDWLIKTIRHGDIGRIAFRKDIYSFPKGITWQQWIDTENTIFTYKENDTHVFYDNVEIMFKELNNTYSLVSKTDLIYDDGYYTIGNACLKGNTLIKTSQGNKNINILKIGDCLSNNNKVEKIVRHNRNYYYRIILNNNDVIEASNDHRFILLNKEIKTTEQLKINDYLTNDLYVKEIRKINQSLDMYEIKTSTNKYELYNGIICECENI